jgi:hypothetical protein
MTDSTSDLRAKMRADLTAAIRGRDRLAIATLRSFLAAIDSAEAIPEDEAANLRAAGRVEAPRRDLTAEGLARLLEADIRERQAAAEQYRRLGRDEKARDLLAGAELLATYLEG